MQGRVKTYNEDRAFGFIIGEDGHDYFFHLSEWKSVAPVLRGTSLVFTPNTAEKGRSALEITPNAPVTNKAEFIVLGPERIKLKNIKNYGISTGTAYYVKVYEHKPTAKTGLFGKVKITNSLVWSKNDIQIPEENTSIARAENGTLRYNGVKVYDPKMAEFRMLESKPIRNTSGEISFDSRYTFDRSSDLYKTPQEYLFITTYQNENYQWFKNLAPFDIYEKCNELDKYLATTGNAD